MKDLLFAVRPAPAIRLPECSRTAGGGGWRTNHLFPTRDGRGRSSRRRGRVHICCSRQTAPGPCGSGPCRPCRVGTPSSAGARAGLSRRLTAESAGERHKTRLEAAATMIPETVDTVWGTDLATTLTGADRGGVHRRFARRCASPLARAARVSRSGAIPTEEASRSEGRSFG
jgi:hypothetical protein